MGHNTYLGGHTLIGPHTPEWFGQVEERFRGDEAFQSAVAELNRLLAEQASGKRGRNFRRKLAAARKAVRDFRPMKAVQRKPLTREAESKIAELKRHLSALAKQAQSAAAMHEQHRQELISLLEENGLPHDDCAELRKLKL